MPEKTPGNLLQPQEPEVERLTNSDAPREVFAYSCRLLPELNRDQMLAVLRSRHAFDASIFDDREPFFWPAEISNNSRDAYDTRMAVSTLANYAADAEMGVSFQNSHRSDELPLGRSFAGRYTGAQGNGSARTEARFYTLRGLNLNGVPTNEFIDGVRSGIISDVSVGFHLGADGYYRCSFCGEDMLGGKCRHIPGLEYDQKDAKGKVTGRTVAVAWVENARLAEVSAVYDGATPNCCIRKAQQESEAGRLRPEAARLIEQRYRITLPAAHRSWPGADVRPEEERTMPDDPITPPIPGPAAPVPVPFEPVRALLHEVGITVSDDPLPGLRDLVTELRTLRPLKAENERLAKEADDGRTYRADLTAEALREGVRAYGATFPEEQYKTQFVDAPLDFIKTNRDLWTAQAGEKLQPGRQSADVGDPEPRPEPVGRYTHASAHAG